MQLVVVLVRCWKARRRRAPSATRVEAASHGTTRVAAARRGGGLLQLKHFFVDQLADVSFPERLLVYVLCT